ncbi:vestitone reductase [Eucalyptus grandis]|uniref:vestitone reductase n=1 Tax=Eucalyptus grandis TaxID=71139 RepID=UPI00192EB04E|nr:vestitone reductase [Eucalyptus grandis]
MRPRVPHGAPHRLYPGVAGRGCHAGRRRGPPGGVLAACLGARTVKRVVYTATASACLFSGEDLDVANEGTWSDLEVCRRSPFYPNYLVSKTVTEKEALEFGERHGLEVVTCVLPTVTGPFITPSVPGSVGLTASILAGNVQWYELLPMWYLVHTDDAARALIFLMESPKVKGRYVCRALELRTHELAEFMAGRYPELNITITDKMKELKDRKATSLSSKKLLDAGFEYKYGVEEMFDDMVRCCRALGHF